LSYHLIIFFFDRSTIIAETLLPYNYVISLRAALESIGSNGKSNYLGNAVSLYGSMLLLDGDRPGEFSL
jgi:hypothetical protein